MIAKKRQELREVYIRSSAQKLSIRGLLMQGPVDTSSCSEPPTSATGDTSFSLPSLYPPMSPLDPNHEGDLSRSILQLRLSNSANASEDSFSSSADTEHNKGALAFLNLLEGVLASRQEEESAIELDELLIQMMDLSMDKRLSNTHEIASVLNEQGWDASQVHRVWHVSTGEGLPSAWSFETLGLLGGKNVSSRIWHRLKELELTGNAKRPLEDEHCKGDQSKKQRLSSTGKEQKCMIETHISPACSKEATPFLKSRKDSHSTPIDRSNGSQKTPRRKRRARRTGPLSTPTITN